MTRTDPTNSEPSLRLSLAPNGPAVSAGRHSDQRHADASTGARTKKRDSTYRRLLGIADLLAGTAAVLLIGLVWSDAFLQLLAGLIVIVPIAKMSNLYDRDEYVLHKTTLDEVPKLLNLSLLFVLIAFAARDLLLPDFDDRFAAGELSAMVLCTLVMLTGFRIAARRIARALTPTERCLLVGAGDTCDRFAQLISAPEAINASLVGQVRVDTDEMADDPHLTRHIAALRQVIAERRVERIVIVTDDRLGDEVPELILAVKSIGVKVSIAPRMLDAIGTAVESDDIGGLQLMGVRDLKMTTSTLFLKRTMDLVLATIGLILAAPLLMLVALAIKLDSRGPVFYRQTRIGRDGKAFKIVKFRSMRVGAHAEREELMDLNEATGLFKISDDPRVTRVGRILRRTSIDELPQLFNVVAGDMSLVGPRPLVPEEDENIAGWYRRRSQIMPGITGAWQLLGPVRIPLQEMAKLDYLYVTHWSLWSDVKILLRTVPHVLGRRGV